MTPARRQRVRKKLLRIVEKAYRVLETSSALEAAVYAVALLEDDPEFNAGTGAVLQADGRARLSASVMDGSNLVFSAVVNLEGYKNPVWVAAGLQKESARVLAGRGAALFAKRMGLRKSETRTAAALRRWKRRLRQGSDTVGACALDAEGRLAAATSTGGRGMEHPGRVSDSCMPAGNYACGSCAVSATGNGEQIMSQGLAVRIAVRAADGMMLSRALKSALRESRSRGQSLGAIALDKSGRIARGKRTESLPCAWKKRSRTGIDF